MLGSASSQKVGDHPVEVDSEAVQGALCRALDGEVSSGGPCRRFSKCRRISFGLCLSSSVSVKTRAAKEPWTAGVRCCRTVHAAAVNRLLDLLSGFGGGAVDGRPAQSPLSLPLRHK